MCLELISFQTKQLPFVSQKIEEYLTFNKNSFNEKS